MSNIPVYNFPVSHWTVTGFDFPPTNPSSSRVFLPRLSQFIVICYTTNEVENVQLNKRTILLPQPTLRWQYSLSTLTCPALSLVSPFPNAHFLLPTFVTWSPLAVPNCMVSENNLPKLRNTKFHCRVHRSPAIGPYPDPASTESAFSDTIS